MMTLRQFYLTKLAEECQEVAKRALKSMQFGTNQTQATDGLSADKNAETSLSNAQRLRGEVEDLLAVIALVENNTDDLPLIPFEEHIHRTVNKTTKIQKYLEYSQSLGMVERG
jgi:NTP pyrophosphatase (non-canonical NTP hydrolase)